MKAVVALTVACGALGVGLHLLPPRAEVVLLAHGRWCPSAHTIVLEEGTREVRCGNGRRYLLRAQLTCEETPSCALLPVMCFDVESVGPSASLRR